MLTGPIHARFEDHRLRSCGREQPPITTQELGPDDRDVEHAWGANMTRPPLGARARRALRRVAAIDGGGDEQEWQERLLASGGRIRYVAAAALDHRRAGDDARLRSLAAAAYGRGAPGAALRRLQRRARRRWRASCACSRAASCTRRATAARTGSS